MHSVSKRDRGSTLSRACNSQRLHAKEAGGGVPSGADQQQQQQRRIARSSALCCLQGNVSLLPAKEPYSLQQALETARRLEQQQHVLCCHEASVLKAQLRHVMTASCGSEVIGGMESPPK